MDATRIREAIEAAIQAQDALEVAEAALEAATKAKEAARARQRTEVGNLSTVLNTTAVAYGDKLVRVGNDGNGKVVVVAPLVVVPATAPLPAPLPEAAPVSVTAKAERPSSAVPPPMSGGKVPDLTKKPGGR